MRITKYITAAVMALALAGCANKYKVDSIDAPTAKLPREAGVYVMLPTPGRFDATLYKDSGEQVADASQSALLRYTQKVERARTVEGLEAARSAAQARGLPYVLEPIILHWEDRATEWSGRPDRITIKLSVYEAASGRQISTTVSRASSRWATFGGDHPQHLLPELTQRYVDTLY